MEQHIMKVLDLENKETLTLVAEFKGNLELYLVLIQNSKAFCAEVKRDQFENLAKQFDLSSQKYYDNIREHLITTPEYISFRFSKNEFSIHRKGESSFSIKNFFCKVQKTEYSNCVYNLMEKFYNDRSICYEKVPKLEKENEHLKTYIHELEQKLTELVERRRLDEEELYSNFVLVLNEKKKRIQHLQELVEAFRRGRPTVNPVFNFKTKKRTIVKNEPVASTKEVSDTDSSENEASDNDYNTDDEKLGNSKKMASNENPLEAIPSTSKAAFDLFPEDSPPRHVLPKRAKRNGKTESMKLSLENASKAKLEDEPESVKIQTEPVCFDFSTQELLDNL